MAMSTTEDELQGRAEQLELPIDANTQTLRQDLGIILPDELSKVLRVTEQTLTSWRCTGEGPAFSKTGKGVVYRTIDVRDWLEQRRQVPGARRRQKEAA